jgi:chaperonin cofactor prefoldin
MNPELEKLECRIQDLHKEVQSLQSQLDELKIHLAIMAAYSNQKNQKQDRIDN